MKKEMKGKSADEIINSNTPMVIKMKFVRSVGSKKLIGAWNTGFKKGTITAALKKDIETFNGYFKDFNAKSGDTIDLVYSPASGLRVYLKGVPNNSTIKGLEFKKSTFAIFLGKKPADKGLKKGMLAMK